MKLNKKPMRENMLVKRSLNESDWFNSFTIGKEKISCSSDNSIAETAATK